jgi:hypothetical protein
MKASLKLKSILLLMVFLSTSLVFGKDTYTFLAKHNSTNKVVEKVSPLLSYTGQVSGTEGSTLSLSAMSNLKGNINYSVSNGTGMAYISGTTLNLVKAGTVTVTITLSDSADQIFAGINKEIVISPQIKKMVKEDKGVSEITFWGSGNMRGPVHSYSLDVDPKSELDFLKLKVTGNAGNAGAIAIYDTNGQLVQKVANGELKSGTNEYKVSISSLNPGDYIVQLETSAYLVKKKISISSTVNPY